MSTSIITTKKSFEVLSPFSPITISFFSSDLEKKLDAERSALKKSNDELIETQKKVRMLEIDCKQITTTYNQLIHDHQSSKENNERMREQLESDNQRRSQYDKDLKQLQQQLNQSLQKEKQIQEQLNKYQQENERLTKDLRQINNEYQTIKTKISDYEDQIEG